MPRHLPAGLTLHVLNTFIMKAIPTTLLKATSDAPSAPRSGESYQPRINPRPG